jgi:hypothetical protein
MAVKAWAVFSFVHVGQNQPKSMPIINQDRTVVRLSVSCRPVIPTYKLQVKTRSGTCTHAPPRALQHWTLPPSRGGLWGCHVSSGSGSRLPDKKCFDIATCIMVPDPVSLQGRIRCVMCPTALDPASL